MASNARDYDDRFYDNDADGKSGGNTTNALIAGAAGFGLGLLAAAGRKAAVQAVTYAAGDWFDGLKAEHKQANGIFDLIEQTTTEDVKKRAALLFSLQHALGKHGVQEEDIIYCAVREHGAQAEADDLNHDHGYVKQYLYDLEMMDKASPLWIGKVREFRALIEAHVRKEEEEIYPRLRAQLSPEQNKKLTNRMNREGFKVA